MARFEKGAVRKFTDAEYKKMTDAYEKAGNFAGAAKLLGKGYYDKIIRTEMERRGDYTPKERISKAEVDMAMAVLAANAGNYQRTARDTGHNVKTIRLWEKMKQKEAGGGDPTIEESHITLAQRIDLIVVKLTKNIEKKIARATLRDLIYATKELTGTRERLIGTGNLTVPKDMSMDERLRKLSEILGAARKRPNLSVVPDEAESDDKDESAA